MKSLILLPLLALLSPGCDSSAPGKGAAASTSASGAAGAAAGAPNSCTALSAHVRAVWASEARPGLERRAGRATEAAATAWARACAEVAAAPLSAADIEAIQKAKTFAALKAMDAASSKGALAALIKAAQGAVEKTELAFAAPPSGATDCEDALVAAAFCGDEVDKASVRSAAKSKDEGACAALDVLLAKKCAQQ